ncbi:MULTISPECIES: McrC family protein [Methylococcus]|uniref:McrC family protein n=1 Tax=Methylococcus TaxID=413 RepID=UPI001C52B7C7|nr:McrC family protein [Methylococcus capsulatus]QXP92544.1 McrC family protein [Methylococcus capsulatus]
MIKLHLKDSQLEGERLVNRSIGNIIQALDTLDELIEPAGHGTAPRDKLRALQWAGAKIKALETSPITYHRNANDIVDVFTSHYVGFFITDDVCINIAPRLFLDDTPQNDENGWRLFCHMLGYANNAHLAEGQDRWKENGNGFSWPWFMAILWLAALERGMINNIIPKSYITTTKNLDTVRGRIVFSDHIRKNIVNQVKQCCEFDELSFNVPINRAVLAATLRLNEQNVPDGMLWEALEHCEKLLSLGVKCDPEITPDEIDDIDFTMVTETYRPAMSLAKMILGNSGADRFGFDGMGMPSALFVDLASLWEDYIFCVLKRHLPPEFRIESPNYSNARTFMLEGNARPIRPDFLVYKSDSNQLVGIIDAKYKNYRILGSNEKVPYAVAIGDFYQMNTYLLHYSNQGSRPLTGLFVAPANADNDDIVQYTGNENLKIGLCNFPVSKLLDNNKTEESHREFADRIAEALRA